MSIHAIDIRILASTHQIYSCKHPITSLVDYNVGIKDINRSKWWLVLWNCISYGYRKCMFADILIRCIGPPLPIVFTIECRLVLIFEDTVQYVLNMCLYDVCSFDYQWTTYQLNLEVQLKKRATKDPFAFWVVLRVVCCRWALLSKVLRKAQAYTGWCVHLIVDICASFGKLAILCHPLKIGKYRDVAEKIKSLIGEQVEETPTATDSEN